MANPANMNLEKCKVLLQEVVTELNSSSNSNSGATTSVTSAGSSQLSDSLHAEHRRLFGFQNRGGGRGPRYNPFSRGGPRPLKAWKAKRQPTWTRTFVCLPNKSDAFPPSFSEYARLRKAGLGEKKVTLNLDFGPLEVDQKLKEAFPKLEDSGGYSLLRTPERGCRNLTLIEGPYSVEILKGSIGQGKVFIRPLQSDLKLTEDPAVNRSDDDLLETCLNCKKLIFMSELPSHIESCWRSGNDEIHQSTSESDQDTSIKGITVRTTSSSCTSTSSTAYSPSVSGGSSNSSTTYSLPLIDGVSTSGSSLGIPMIGVTGSLQLPGGIGTSSTSLSFPLSDASSSLPSIGVDTACGTTSRPLSNMEVSIASLKEIFPHMKEDDLKDVYQDNFLDVDATITEILNKSSAGDTLLDENSNSMEQILSTLKPKGYVPLRISVRREHIFEDSITFFKKRDYDINKPVVVCFEGEAAVDGGGPGREYFTLLLQSLLSPLTHVKLFEGTSFIVQPLHNTDALRASMFKVAGRMIAASIVNGGPSFPHLSPAVYKYLTSISTENVLADITRSDVVDYEVLEAIDKVDAATVDNMNEVHCEVQTLLADAGFPQVLSMCNKLEAITALCVHSVILSRKAELDQFALGLAPVLGLAKKYPYVMKSLLVSCLEPAPASVTPAVFKSLLVFEEVQEKVKEFFLEYMDKEAHRLPDLLMFCTGTNQVPPLGFHSPDKITVLELQPEYGPLPNANTCPQELELPCTHDNFESFKESLNKALDIQGSGFGIV